ncbi:hypothetical protein [Salarchaeum sp. III]|uniref:hypothetical protein n=1 Tax=Salarchaeum sp. III TaxID=3107927 RepID=UPI002ED8ED43
MEEYRSPTNWLLVSIYLVLLAGLLYTVNERWTVVPVVLLASVITFLASLGLMIRDR